MHISKELKDLSSEQQELLLLLLKEEGIDHLGLPIIAQSKSEGLFPLAFAQRRLWILNQLEPHSATYNMFGALHFVGSLNSDVLEKCFNDIIKRHAILRASFSLEEGNPVLMIAPDLKLKLNVIDLSQSAVNVASPAVEQLIRTESQTLFDLSAGPLLRASLVRLANAEYILLFTMHHIISDAWSLQIIIQELDAFYQSAMTGKHVPLPYLAIQYYDYTIWQQEILHSPAFANSVEYWRNQLQNAEHILNLPTDGRRQALQTYSGSRVKFNLPKALGDRIKALSLKEDVSTFMFLLATFKVLLFRYTHQEDISVGTVVSNRNRAELEHLIGIFSNTLVLRSDLSGNPEFHVLLSETKKMVLDAFSHQDVPFEKLVEELKVVRDLSRHPLFQVMFVYEDKTTNFSINGVSANKLNIENENSKFDLTLFIEGGEKGFKGSIEYNTDLFAQGTINSYAESFVSLLESIVLDPGKRLSELKIVSESQKQAFLAWKDSSGVAKNYCLHQLFEKWAALTPEEIAVSFQGKYVTYQELNEQSNKIAHGLIKLGIKRNQPVAMMLETGIDQVVVLLAISKAGGVFVCLDRDYPVLRLKQILEEVQPACFISDVDNLNVHNELLLSVQFEAAYQMTITNIADLVCDKPNNPNVDVLPTDPVYIVYTSGSTGKPKGILQAHGCSAQYMEWQSNEFKIQSGKRMAQWASITYDASYSEIFGALCVGATLCMAKPQDRRDPKAIADWLIEEKINVVQLVPSFCGFLLQSLMSSKQILDESLASLEFVLLAGERLPVELARTFQRYFNNKTRLYNLYGPSEIVLTTQYLVDDVPLEMTSIPVGRPFAGRQILILDKHHQLCPLRVPGEIYIKSPYLTLGYYKQSDETNKVFVQNPLHNDYSDRVYKTGDRGRWMNHDEIEFLGRNDNQLKIRGSRVELGEVEAVLAQHNTVNECAIIAKHYPDGSPYLVAFIKSQEKITVSTLREFLADYLPSYMIPTNFVFLEAMPHTISGKVDRKKLGTYTDFHQETVDEIAIPATELEKKIAVIWKELLLIDVVRNDSNFFDMGGHSLLMVRAQLKLNQALGRDIPLVDMFKFPTIRSLAGYLSKDANQEMKDDFSQQAQQRALLRKRLLKKTTTK